MSAILSLGQTRRADRAGGGGGGGASSCSITLTSDAATGFGAKTPTISGQTFSVAPADGSGLYLASTAVPGSRRAIPTTRVLWIHLPTMTAIASVGGGSVAAGFLLYDSGGTAIRFVKIETDSSGNINMRATIVGGGEDWFYALGTSDKSAEYIGIGNDPDVGAGMSVWHYNPLSGAKQTVSGKGAGYLTSVGAVDCLLLGEVDLTGGGTGTYESTFVTDQSGFGVDLSNDGEDFCGNVIT